MPRKRNDAPLVSAHDYQTWLRWVFLKAILQEESNQSRTLVQLAHKHQNDEMAVNLWLALEDWVREFQFQLQPWSDWTQSASYDIARALNGHPVFVNGDRSSMLSPTPTLTEVLEAAIRWKRRSLDFGSSVPGSIMPGMSEPPRLPHFFPRYPYETEQKKYEFTVQKMVHEFTERVIAMHAAGKIPKPIERPNLNRDMKWVVYKIQRKTYNEIAEIDQFQGTEVAIGKAINRLIADIGLQIVTREKQT